MNEFSIWTILKTIFPKLKTANSHYIKRDKIANVKMSNGQNTEFQNSEWKEGKITVKKSSLIFIYFYFLIFPLLFIRYLYLF